MVASVTDLDLTRVDEIIDSLGADKGGLISILQQVQAAYGWLDKPVLQRIADRLDVPLTRIYGVATFYSQFYLEKRGKKTIRICDGTACHVRGAAKLVQTAEDFLKLKPGETSEDGEYTLEVVYCLGACALSPIVVVNGNIVGAVSVDKLTELLKAQQTASE